MTDQTIRRVAVTGMGIVSSIGANLSEVRESLRSARSGISRAPEYAERGFRSQVHGLPPVRVAEALDRKTRRFMGDSAGWNYLAMQEAIADAGLSIKEVRDERTGLVMGSGGPSSQVIVAAADLARQKGARRVLPTRVPPSMCSANSAALSVAFGTRGVNYSISSACATSAHCIGHGGELIQLGKQDIVFAGGGEEVDWVFSLLFDAMGAMSSKYNQTPQTASRPYDAGRDGFVISGGGGVVVLEEMERARARGARIYAELAGYGATADGRDMVQPTPEGAARCMRQALAGLEGPVDYINPHATSTPVGDISEIEALGEVFGAQLPPISATKALTGHALGAAGVHEAIYALLMLEGDFICPSAHIETLDPAFAGIPIQRALFENAGLNCVLSNSFGFGGTNATLVFRRARD